MKTARDVQDETLQAKHRLRAWEAIKHRYPVNTEWWRDFYLSPGHAESREAAQELARRAADEIAAEELQEEARASEAAARSEAVNRSPEARASRRADGLRILFFNVGNLGAVFLLLYFVLRLAGRNGLLWLDILWVLGLFVAPFCYVMAFVFTLRATSLWEKAWSRQK